MTTVQPRLPFKSRKQKFYSKLKNDSSKSNLENVNTVNLLEEKSKLLKRALRDPEGNDQEECSPTKKVRPILTSNVKSNSTERDADHEPLLEVKELTCREKEIAQLKSFLSEHLTNETSGSLYISGQPGTGKTECLSYILQLKQFKNGYKEVYVNCTMMKSAGSIYMRICKELKLKTSGTTEKACLKAIEKYLDSPHRMTLLVLDEIDQLDSQRQSVLYTIFEWPARPDSKLVLVGIANALDLTERTLPRLQARCEMRPSLMHFPPYTKQQIIEIFTKNLSENGGTLFSPVALQMLAAKIAAVSGDMRRALDIGKRVIHLARRNKFAETQSLSSMLNDCTATVELKQVLSVLNNIYGGSQNLEADVDEAFPLQQKLVICSLMLMLTKGNNKDIVIARLYDVYKRVAKSRNIVAVDSSEFFCLCSLIETRGIIKLSGKKEPRAQKVTLQWDQSEVYSALRDKTLIADIMNDVKCLTR